MYEQDGLPAQHPSLLPLWTSVWCKGRGNAMGFSHHARGWDWIKPSKGANSRQRQGILQSSVLLSQQPGQPERVWHTQPVKCCHHWNETSLIYSKSQSVCDCAFLFSKNLPAFAQGWCLEEHPRVWVTPGRPWESRLGSSCRHFSGSHIPRGWEGFGCFGNSQGKGVSG